MTDHKTPGVYIEEVNAFPASVVPVESAIPAFIGCTEQAVGPKGDALAGLPTRIASMLDYEASFGRSPLPPPRGSAVPESILPYALRHYFDNGGGPCYILSLGTFGSAGAATWIKAIAALESVADVTLLVFPDATTLGAADYADVVNAALASAQRLRSRFVIADVPNAVPGGMDAISAIDADFRARLTRDPSLLQHGAAYFPYLQTTIFPQLAGRVATRAAGVVLPPSAAVAGLMVATDQARGVWKAPANVAVASVVAPIIAVDDVQQQAFNVDPTTGKSINVIRAFTGRGTMVWGARTLAGNDNEFRYVSVRRAVTYFESSIRLALMPYTFEANDASTWTRVRAMIENFLMDDWRAGGLVGSTPKEAFAVRVGLGETMTAQDLLDGRLRVQVMVAMVRPAEFIIIQLEQRLATA